ncbi:MAG TPA: cytochrome c [Croceibacterium sp.]|jgi:cytochrome c556
MKKTLLLVLPALALLAACSHKNEQQQAQAEPTFHDVMKDQVDKHADEVWDDTNAAVGDKGGLDPAKMTDDMWKKLAEDATAVQEGAQQIAQMDKIVVIKPGETIADAGVPGGHSAAEVQAGIDKNPQGLRDHAANLAATMGDLVKAGNAHDAAKAGPIVDSLDGVCEGCHLDYWYPDQKALVEKIIKENK